MIYCYIVMKILLTNDDGINAPGIQALYDEAKNFGEIVIVAPSIQKSASSQSIIIGKDMTYYETNHFDCPSYAVDGNPVDCIKLAARHIFKNNLPDLVLSGINWGANLGVSVLYSGTVAAALEGSIQDISSIAFSLDIDGDQDFSFAKKIVHNVLKKQFHRKVPKRTTLNINIPNIKESDFSGYKYTHQADSTWNEKYTIRPKINNKDTVILEGKLVDCDTKQETDIKAFEQNYVSITPLSTSYTDITTLTQLMTNS